MVSVVRGAAPFDWWSVPHFLAGVALALLGVPWQWALVVIVGYEVVEAVLRQFPAASVPLFHRFKAAHDGVFEYESWPNILVDVVVAVLAYGLTSLALPGVDVWP